MSFISLDDAVSAYLEDMRSHGRSFNTIRHRRIYTRRFATAVETEGRKQGRRGPALTSWIDHPGVTAYFLTFKDDASQSARNAGLLTLRGFLRFCERRQYIGKGETEDLLGDCKAAPARRKPKYYIPVGHFMTMLDLAGERHPSERAAFALTLYTLGRVSEITGLKLRDIDLTKRMIFMRRPKTKDHLEIAICPELAAELERWLLAYSDEMGYESPAVMVDENPDWHLIPHLHMHIGKQRDDRGHFSQSCLTWSSEPEVQAIHLERLVKRLLSATGAQTQDGRWVKHLGEGWHTIRRSGARAMLDYLASLPGVGQDKALLRVSIMLGHKDTQTTLLYVGMDIERAALNDFLMDSSPYGACQTPQRRRGNVVAMETWQRTGKVASGDQAATQG